MNRITWTSFCINKGSKGRNKGNHHPLSVDSVHADDGQKATTTRGAIPGKVESMKAPTVNNNGTPREQLQGEYLAAISAIDAAIKAIGEITVHGRDYPNQGDLRAAQNELATHYAWMKATGEMLVGVYLEIDSNN